MLSGFIRSVDGMDKAETNSEVYEAPALRRLGSVADITQNNTTGAKTDVPFGTPVPPFSIFS
jgi:hypothetical protein